MVECTNRYGPFPAIIMRKMWSLVILHGKEMSGTEDADVKNPSIRQVSCPSRAAGSDDSIVLRANDEQGTSIWLFRVDQAQVCGEFQRM